ncbi:MAG: DUF3253 domain-containing protein [Bdellovibrionota bacterium]
MSDHKNCPVCKSQFTVKDHSRPSWNLIVYCSDDCRLNKWKVGHNKKLEKQILEMVSHPEVTTICPSDVLPPEQQNDWTQWEAVREAARRLVARGEIELTQMGEVVDPFLFKGQVRFRKKQNWT